LRTYCYLIIFAGVLSFTCGASAQDYPFESIEIRIYTTWKSATVPSDKTWFENEKTEQWLHEMGFQLTSELSVSPVQHRSHLELNQHRPQEEGEPCDTWHVSINLNAGKTLVVFQHCKGRTKTTSLNGPNGSKAVMKNSETIQQDTSIVALTPEKPRGGAVLKCQDSPGTASVLIIRGVAPALSSGPR
jgi:hypothetical protein